MDLFRSVPASRSRLASDSLNGGVDTPPRAFTGTETPAEYVQRYTTEDTPAVFSRNDSLSSLEFEDHEKKGNFILKGISNNFDMGISDRHFLNQGFRRLINLVVLIY